MASAATAIIGFFTFIVLIVYTKETYQLRKTAEQQLEAAEKPCLLFELLSEKRPLNGKLVLKQPTLTNIGVGPALTIQITKITLDKYVIEFGTARPYLSSKEKMDLEVETKQDGEPLAFASQLFFLAHVIETTLKDKELELEIRFESIVGQSYLSRNKISYDGSRVATAWIPPLEKL